MADHIHNNHNDSKMSHPYVSEPKSYALSGRIMLSAIIVLFAVVVIMICLHVYARWYILRARRRQIRRARRRTHLVFYIEPDNPSNIVPISTHGLESSVLKLLPTFTFSKKEENEEILECAVCLSEFEEREKGRMLPKCKHCFHVECIDMWFHSHSTCPLCRSPVDASDISTEFEPTAASGEVVVELSELNQSQLGLNELTQEVVPSQAELLEGCSDQFSSSSVGGRRKGMDMVGVSIEVPRRSQSFCFPAPNSDESGPSRSPSGFKSPTSRILSFKRILSREKKSPLPSPSSCAAGSSYREFDIESGRVESSSQILTPTTPKS
ncbi:RING-H2 finger protein ATL2 [Amaranthus tricolor]|uniref:RING-H2 finger protein ATL2 n=1 Tax=Amaranthus tricolor TaxID=29722 RepID=UPI002582F038|nr:RING-H2 finger protein ATL2 [Amaranthus tricolor]